MTNKEALLWGHETLLLSSVSARLDAEVLLAFVLGKEVTFLLAHDVDNMGFWKLRKYKKLIKRRKKGEPVAYITGHKEFYGLDFIVNKDVLAPRPDTEVLVECVIKQLRITNYELRIILIDVGTGSGCIPISVLKNVPDITAVAVDISSSALKIARKNAELHGVYERMTFIKSDLFENVPRDLFEGKDIVLTANLPYIPTEFDVRPELKYEPSIALYGGDDGMDVYKGLVEQIAVIKPRIALFELFEWQIALLKIRLPDYELMFTQDMSGEAKCIGMSLNASF